eukprot:1161385-Pelagomonas_calceolata.AAC.3
MFCIRASDQSGAPNGFACHLRLCIRASDQCGTPNGFACQQMLASEHQVSVESALPALHEPNGFVYATNASVPEVWTSVEYREGRGGGAQSRCAPNGHTAK